jgi:hypothetical protein
MGQGNGPERGAERITTVKGKGTMTVYYLEPTSSTALQIIRPRQKKEVFPNSPFTHVFINTPHVLAFNIYTYIYIYMNVCIHKYLSCTGL